ncbi:MAG: rhodanese-like domain-containing protein [Bacteroidales bacterium]|jgi:rhodanese-related sulfurtransferase
MKSLYKAIILIPAIGLAMSGCTGGKSEKKISSATYKPVEIKSAPVIGDETSLLLKELKANGDYVNTKQYPSLIKASLVNELKGDNNLIIDLRSKSEYSAGHIKGAVNKKFEELPSWFETGIKPFRYEKIILVCDDGQISSYATSLLRLKGYGNVFALRWGMSGWNKQLAENGWLKGLSGKYESQLDTVTHNKPAATGLPELKTGLTVGKEVSDVRFAKVFGEGTSGIFITADEVFSNPSAYYIINLERKDKYSDGHIPGAVRYKPDGTLGIVDELATIPYDKPVVVYCGTGHNSAFATAYLRLFGYDARTLKYGNNSFMHNRMVMKREALSWLPFSDEDVNNFPVVK